VRLSKLHFSPTSFLFKPRWQPHLSMPRRSKPRSQPHMSMPRSSTWLKTVYKQNRGRICTVRRSYCTADPTVLAVLEYSVSEMLLRDARRDIIAASTLQSSIVYCLKYPVKTGTYICTYGCRVFPGLILLKFLSVGLSVQYSVDYVNKRM
jgi:hypothetical protein